MALTQIRARLTAYRPHVIEEPRVARAAVALVLADPGDGVELLLIRRATRDDDPWSGHMALPGGRRDPDDADAVATASRETLEEVGVDLGADAEVIGRLDELRAVARHRPLDLVITPVVFVLHRAVVLRPSPREVESAVWVPLSFLDRGPWEATTWSDGANADKVGTDYRRRVSDVTAPGALSLDLAPGGGAVVRLRRK